MTVLDAIDGWAATWQVPHAAAAVVSPDGVLETRGDVDQVFPLASVTKLLSAWAIMLGVEEGAVGLDDPAGPPGATLRHLLAHTSGYGFESDAGVIARVGTRRIYSNRGIEVAADHLAAAADMPFTTYLAEGLLVPLGLAATSLPGSPAAGGQSSVADLTRFAAELLSPRLLSAETVRDMMAVQFPGLSGVLPGHGRFDPLDWGLGFEHNFSRPGHWGGSLVSPDTAGHFGASGTFLWVDPRARLACVCLTDRGFGDWSRQEWPKLCDAVITEYAGRS